MLVFFVTAIPFASTAQTPDLVRLEYTVTPENDFGIRTNRYRAVINAPIKLSTENFLVVGMEYNRYEFNIVRELPFASDNFLKLHIIDLNLGYSFMMNPTWRIVGVLTPRIASNIERGLDNNDLRLNASLVFWKEKKELEKPYRLILGLSFNSATGLPFPLPLINYYKRFHKNWSYTLGIPRSDFKYYIKDKHVFQTALFLDGYFVNIQNDIALSDDKLGAAISLSTMVGALGYQYKITKEISLYALAGYSILQQNLIRDGNRDRAFTLNNQGNFYLRTGFKIGIF